MWIDIHCHLDAPEFAGTLPLVIQAAQEKSVKAILLPAVRVVDCSRVKELTHKHSQKIPGLVYTLGIHPLYTNQAQASDIETLEKRIIESISDPRFMGVGEIGLDYFVEDLDPHQQEFFLCSIRFGAEIRTACDIACAPLARCHPQSFASPQSLWWYSTRF